MTTAPEEQIARVRSSRLNESREEQAQFDSHEHAHGARLIAVTEASVPITYNVHDGHSRRQKMNVHALRHIRYQLQ